MSAKGLQEMRIGKLDLDDENTKAKKRKKRLQLTYCLILQSLAGWRPSPWLGWRQQLLMVRLQNVAKSVSGRYILFFSSNGKTFNSLSLSIPHDSFARQRIQS